MIDTPALNQLLDAVQFDANGLISAVAQDAHTGEILMLAWMNRAALSETLSSGQAVYYSRSRHTLWRKGESSGQQQRCLSMLLDCDRDAIVLQVEQTGVACHTGLRSCFSLAPDTSGQWVAVADVLIDPSTLYGQSS